MLFFFFFYFQFFCLGFCFGFHLTMTQCLQSLQKTVMRDVFQVKQTNHRRPKCLQVRQFVICFSELILQHCNVFSQILQKIKKYQKKTVSKRMRKENKFSHELFAHHVACVPLYNRLLNGIAFYRLSFVTLDGYFHSLIHDCDWSIRQFFSLVPER